MIRVLILTCWQNQKAKSLWVPCKRWRMSLIPSFKTTHMSAQTHRQTVTLCPSMPASLQAALHQVSLILSSTLCETSPLPKDPLAEMILTPQPAPTWGQKIRPMVLPTSSPPVLGPGQQFYNTLQYPVQLCQNGLTLIACDTGGICTRRFLKAVQYFSVWSSWEILLSPQNLLFLCALLSKTGPKTCSLYSLTDGNYIREKPSTKEALARNVSFMLHSIKHSRMYGLIFTKICSSYVYTWWLLQCWLDLHFELAIYNKTFKNIADINSFLRNKYLEKNTTQTLFLYACILN